MTLIGANGAGKSTTLRSINGLNHPRQGTIRFQRPGHHERRAARDRQDGHRAVARGAPALPAHERAREPRDGRLPARRQRELQGGPRPRLRALPAARRAEAAEGRDAVGRRAADVRDGPRADGAAEAAAARRAVDGAGADLRREDLRDRRARSTRRGRRPARRAERADGARRGQPRLRARDRQDRARGRRRRSSARERAALPPEGVPRRSRPRLGAGKSPPTSSGKYGGASRKPIRAPPPARPCAISSALEIPCVGTKPSVPCGRGRGSPRRGRRPAGRAPAGTRPSRRTAGAGGRRGRRGRRRAPRSSAAAACSAAASSGAVRRSRSAGRRRGRAPASRARSAARGGAARRPCRRPRRGTASRQSRSASPSATVAAVTGFSRSRGEWALPRDPDHDRVERLVEPGRSAARSRAGAPPRARRTAARRRPRRR